MSESRVSDALVLEDRLQCGTVIGGERSDSVLSRARAIEAAGFDSLWVGDHVAFHFPIMEPLTLLSFVAAATSRIRLCTGVYLLPLRHPTTSAKAMATLDVLSGGRLTVGIGVGGEFPPEFEACGVPVAERGPRTDEGIEVLRRLWCEEQAGYEGVHYRFAPIRIAPRPLQRGGPPIIVGGRKGPTMRRAGRLGDGYISHMCSPDQYARNLSTIFEHAGRAGREGAPFETVAFLFTVMDDEHEAACERAGAMLSTMYKGDLRQAAKKYCLLGRPEHMLEQMQAFTHAGCRHFVFSLLSDPNEFQDAFRSVIQPGLARIDF